MKYTIVFIGLFISINLGSQDIEGPASETAEQAAASQEDVSEQGENEIETKNEGQREFDVFRPSEDISEDLAVPFPVDI